MYNNAPQYPNSGYHDTYSQYSQEYTNTYGYQNYGEYPTQVNTSQPPPTMGQGNFPSNSWPDYESNQNNAVAQEMQQQKAQLFRQREDYVKKMSILRHELDQLQIQKQDLLGNGVTQDIDLAKILKENTKLQEEIQGKMKAIHNVIEMLSGIIKDGRSLNDLEAALADPERQLPESPNASNYIQDNAYNAMIPDLSNNASGDSFCYVHYDTGLHWCRMCDEFPETAKDFLLHLQDKKHRERMKSNDVDTTPWHKLPQEPLLPSDENAPKKRVPIKGLQFFIAAPSWYCKLCDVWIGDLHCASQHLKSQAHYKNYENFNGQNPHWEIEWFKDRETSMARKSAQDSSDSDDNRKKRKRKEKLSNEASSLKDKKKKKKSKKRRKHSSDSSSSASSSDSSSDDDNEDRSKSIRVAMRNMKKVQGIMDEDLTAKWNVLEKLVEEHKKKESRSKQERAHKEISRPEDPLINQWMTVSEAPPKEKMLLSSLKDRMRQKHEQERTRQAEIEKIRREKEREEYERSERKRRVEREAEEEATRILKQRDQEELERIRDKERSHIKFKTSNYRRNRRSHSGSGDEDHSNDRYQYDRRHNEREGSYKSHNSRSRSRSIDRERRSPERQQEVSDKKKPPGPPSYKKLPFIGRMPLFKNKQKGSQDEKEEPKEIKKQSYETPRRTRFEPGNLPKAFIPKPEVVCFPKLSSIPPLNVPPPPPIVTARVPVPKPPKISNTIPKVKVTPKPSPPPPSQVDRKEIKENTANLSDDEVLYGTQGANPSMMGAYYQEYASAMYDQNTYYQHQPVELPPPPPHSHSMPLQPPPLPPDDDLALLGICADDMAAQTF